MKYIYTLLLFGFLLYQTPGFSQYQITGKSIMELKKESFQPQTFQHRFLLSSFTVISSGWPEDFDTRFSLSAPEVPKVYSFDELGMFCKFEVQIEKATRFPVKIRLGEVEAVDRKEGKWQYDNWHD